MLNDIPYFMTKREWYTIIPNEKYSFIAELTDIGKSIPKVVQSYNEYYNNL